MGVPPQVHFNNNYKNYTLTTTRRRSIYIHFLFNVSIIHINSFSCIAMYDCTSPIVELQMTTIWTHYTLHLSTSLSHQMPVWGGHLTKCQSDPKDDQMSRWPDIVPYLATRCLCQVCLSSDVPGTSENLNSNVYTMWRYDLFVNVKVSLHLDCCQLTCCCTDLVGH